MKKRKEGRKLSRKRNQRRALLRTLLVSLIKHKKIKTTLAKAKELRPYAEKMITRAKKSTGKDNNSQVAAIRLMAKELPVASVKELMKIASKFSNRNGGYTRILKTHPRKSDQSDMAFIGWVEPIWGEKEREKKEASKAEMKKSKDSKDSNGKRKKTKKDDDNKKRKIEKKNEHQNKKDK